MLASPLVHSAQFSSKMSPPSTTDDPLSFRPARDVEAFNSLLPPPIEFVEGSSSGALAVPEGKYQPINVSPQRSSKDRLDGSPIHQHKTPRPLNPAAPITSPASPSTPPSVKTPVTQSTHSTGSIDLSWPETCDHASGLYNTGNTCFLNSVLQCLLHTPPLLRATVAHGKDKCRARDKFCMICAFRQVAVQAHKSSSPFAPNSVSGRLLTIAKHMRRGRQEDSHEFLRYAIDAMQKACLHGVPQKLEAKLSETTWVHRIFGGKLRSRVSCQGCGHNSDTFDQILDLSLDIIKSDSLKEALRSFISPDYLNGTDKYKCEKCKRHVNAEKRFTIHEAPAVLTVHLKRFSPLGRKIGHFVSYDETLHLQPYMSEDQFGPTYSLYGIICHAGGGPNSGHYYAFVKSRLGRWYEMNDEMVSPVVGGTAPMHKKTAYILFYLRDKGQGMQSLMTKGVTVNGVNGVQKEAKDGEKMGLVAGMKKRREREDDDDDGSTAGRGEEEDIGEKVAGRKPSTSWFIGPLLPSPMDGDPVGRSPTKKVKVYHGDPQTSAKKVDPQAEKIKQKIQAAKEAKAKRALDALGGYDSSSTAGDDEEGEDEDVLMGLSKKLGEGRMNHTKGKVRAIVQSDDDDGGGSDKGRESSPPATSPIPSSKHVPSSPIHSANFYGLNLNKKTPPSLRINDRMSPTKRDSRLRSDGDHEESSDDDSRSGSPRKHGEGHGHRHSKKHKKLEGMKMRMSMESSKNLDRRRGYVTPFARIGSENSAASKGAGASASGGGGRMNTYGKRRFGRARGL